MTISLYRVTNVGDQFGAPQQLVANNLISFNPNCVSKIANVLLTSVFSSKTEPGSFVRVTLIISANSVSRKRFFAAKLNRPDLRAGH